MATEQVALHAFNRGLISPKALARTDLKRLAFSAETMVNWMPRVFGSMMLRPGTAYLGATNGGGSAYNIEFVYAVGDTALIELTDLAMRIWVDDALLTRPSVSATIANGTFGSDITSWTDDDDVGGTSAWVTGGYLGLTGNGTAAARVYQAVTVTETGTVHALRVTVQRGPVTFRVGSTQGGDDYVEETTLRTGIHSLAFTPTGTFYVEFENTLKRQVLVDSVAVEGSGTVSITTPWVEADLDFIRYDQSGDVVFVACDGYQQRRIERRANNSWSIVLYQANDGPFRADNTGPITIASSALSGNVTLTASAPLFRSSLVGALFRITSTGQTVEADATAQNTFTNAIRVTGVDSSRVISYTIAGTFSATWTLQRSLTSDAGPWEDVTSNTTTTTTTYDDTWDNVIVWYRIGVKTGNYTSGTVEMTLSIPTGSIDGIARLTAYSTALSASAEVIEDLGATTATDDWAEGEWSDYRGWPTAVALAEGRLFWAGRDSLWGSESDAYDVFTDETEGDAGYISKLIGSGPVDIINWLLPLQRLMLGGEGGEYSCKSSSLDEPLTQANCAIRTVSTQGSGWVEGVRIDKVGIFIQRGGTRVFELKMDDSLEHQSTDLTLLCPEATSAQVVRMSVQRQPDTRIHCVLNDGTVAIAIYDRAENVLCWFKYTTDGLVKDVSILPGAGGADEDQVYYTVYRSTPDSHYLEKWALESQCVGGTLNRQLDAHVVYSGASTTTITGLTHLNGQTVHIWADGAYVGTGTPSGGSLTLATAATNVVVGLTYTAQWKSTKFSLNAAAGNDLTEKKQINHLGVILNNTHHEGLEYGTDFTTMYNLPAVKDGAIVADDTIHATWDEEPFEFPGQWDSDTRLCLQATAPKPCTILAAIMPVESNAKR